MALQIHVLLHLQGQDGVDIAREDDQAVIRAQGGAIGELIHVTAALEAEGLEDLEGGLHGEAVDVHDTRLFDDVVGVVGLIDGHGDLVGVVGHLGDGIDDEAVVLLAVVAGHHVEAVAQLIEGGEVVLVGGLLLSGQVLTAELVGKGGELGVALVVQGGEDLDVVLGIGEVLTALQHTLHDLGGQRSPGAVLHEGHGAVGEVTLGEVVDELPHEGENVGVVGSGGQHQLAVTEGILHALGHIRAGEVVDHDLGTALGAELVGQLHDRLLGVAVDRGVGDDDALLLGLVGGPGIVEVQVVAQILGEDGAVEGADGLNVQIGGLLEECLYLGTVLTHDADVVAAGLTGPVLLHVQSAELTEAVGGEQDLVGGVVGHHDLGPVDHGGGHEMEGVLTQREGIPLLDDHAVFGEVLAEEILHHGKGLSGGHQNGIGVGLEEVDDIGGVVGLHVLNNEEIGGTASQHALDVVQPLVGEAGVYGVHDGDEVVQDDVGIIGHAVGNNVLALKQIDVVIVDADVADIGGDLHSNPSFLWEWRFDRIVYIIAHFSVFVNTRHRENFRANEKTEALSVSVSFMYPLRWGRIFSGV